MLDKIKKFIKDNGKTFIIVAGCLVILWILWMTK